MENHHTNFDAPDAHFDKLCPLSDVNGQAEKFKTRNVMTVKIRKKNLNSFYSMYQNLLASSMVNLDVVSTGLYSY
jgi:hypothetical protein